MVASLLFDISGIDSAKVMLGVEEIERVNPHREPMRAIDGIIHMSAAKDQVVAFKDVRPGEIWVRDYSPGRPVFPNILMIEAAAQVASYVTLVRRPEARFMGFVAVDQFRFHDQVEPGERLLLLARQVEFRPRRITYNVQGLAHDNIVFDGSVTGMSM